MQLLDSMGILKFFNKERDYEKIKNEILEIKDIGDFITKIENNVIFLNQYKSYEKEEDKVNDKKTEIENKVSDLAMKKALKSIKL